MKFMDFQGPRLPLWMAEMTQHGTISVIPARPRDHALRARVLSRMFRDEPAQTWLFPNRNVRAIASHLWFTALLSAAAERGRIWCLSDRTAAAVWFPPGAGT